MNTRISIRPTFDSNEAVKWNARDKHSTEGVIQNKTGVSYNIQYPNVNADRCTRRGVKDMGTGVLYTRRKNDLSIDLI